MFESFGLKRLIASLLSVIVQVVRVIPGAAEYIIILEMIGGFFGITGIGHAAVAGSVTRKKLATASAAVASLLVICYFIPFLAPFIPYLQTLAGLLGAGALGAQAKQSEVLTKSSLDTQRINSV